VIHERDQRLPIAIRVEEKDRLFMQADLPPCEHFEKLIKRACTSGHDDDGIGIHEHYFFALMHGFGHDELGEVAFADFHIHQMHRDYAEGLATSGLCAARDDAHQADIPCAIHEPPSTRSEGGAKVGGGCRKCGVTAGACAAINTDGRRARERHSISFREQTEF